MAGSFYGNPHFQLQIVEVFENQSDALAKLHTNEILEGQYCVIFQSGNPFIDGAIFKKVLYAEKGTKYIEHDTQKVFAYKQITKIKGDPGALTIIGKFENLTALKAAAAAWENPPYGIAGAIPVEGQETYELYACMPSTYHNPLISTDIGNDENWIILKYNSINDDNINYEYTWSSQKIQEEYTEKNHIYDILYGDSFDKIITEEEQGVTQEKTFNTLLELQQYVAGLSSDLWFHITGKVGNNYYSYFGDTSNEGLSNDDNWILLPELESVHDYHIVGENEALLKHHKHGYLTTNGKLVDINDSHFNSSDDPVMPDESDELNYAKEVPVRTDENGNIIGEIDIPQFNHITGQLDGQIEVNGSSIKIYCNKKPNIVDGGIITGILGGNITDKFATVDVIYRYYTGENQDQEEAIYYAYGNLFVYNNTVGFDNNALRAGQILMLYINVKENIGGTGNGEDDQHPIYNNCEFHVINPQSMYEHSHYISSIKDIESGTWYPTFCGLNIDGEDIGKDDTGLVMDITSCIETQDMRGWYTRVGNTVTIGFQCSAKMIENMYDEDTNRRLIAQIGIRGIPYKCVSRAGGGGVIFHVLQRLNNGATKTNPSSGPDPESPYVATSFYISAGEGVTNGADNTITVRRAPVGFPRGIAYGSSADGMNTNTGDFCRNANLSVCYFPDKGTRFFLYGTICYQTDSSWSKINNVALDNEGGDSAYDQVSTLLAKLEQAEQRIGLLSSQVETILKNYGISSHN